MCDDRAIKYISVPGERNLERDENVKEKLGALIRNNQRRRLGQMDRGNKEGMERSTSLLIPKFLKSVLFPEAGLFSLRMH